MGLKSLAKLFNFVVVNPCQSSLSLNCPLSRVLHVTLANWQEFGFDFHQRSSPSYSEYMDISQPADYFI